MYVFDTVIERRGSHSEKWDNMLSAKNYRISLHDARYQDIIPLWVADMDFRAPQEIIQAIADRVYHGIFGYVHIPRLLYSLVVDWVHARHAIAIDVQSISFSAGVMYSVRSAILALTQKGDEIVVFHPLYSPLTKAVIDNERVPLIQELDFSKGYASMDLDMLQTQVSPRTKMLILCSPHNPSGRVWNESELQALVAFLRTSQYIYM